MCTCELTGLGKSVREGCVLAVSLPEDLRQFRWIDGLGHMLIEACRERASLIPVPSSACHGYQLHLLSPGLAPNPVCHFVPVDARHFDIQDADIRFETMGKGQGL